MSDEWDYTDSFGRWVRRRRKAIDLTQAKLAEKIGCSVITIKKIEQDERRPSQQMAELLATHLLISDSERERFYQRARGHFVPNMPPPFPSDSSSPYLKLPPTPSGSGDNPFVAREEALGGLAALLRMTQTGSGQVCFVIGGAGRGKTMLVHEFTRRAQVENQDLLAVTGFCNAQTGIGDPYLPFREILTLLTGDVEARWAGGLISQQQASRLWQAMVLTIPTLVEQAPDLIGAFVPEQSLRARVSTFASEGAEWVNKLKRLTAMDRSDLRQERIFSQYTAVVKNIAAKKPLLLIIEDLHWIDPSSSGLFFHLSRKISDSPILILGTYRPDEIALTRSGEQHPMTSVVRELKRQYGDIWLDLAEVTDGRRFVDAYLDIQPNQLDESFRHTLFTHTGGHPLFTVELLRDMHRRGDLQPDDGGRIKEGEAINWAMLPAKVEGVIEQRISRLDDELKSILTVAAIQGEFFIAEVIARVQNLDERRLVQRLSQELDKQHRLVTAAKLEYLGLQRLSQYRFRHQLFQHFLYNSLDETERSYLHEEVGAALEMLHGGETDRIAVQLARHFEEAGLTEKAVFYLLQSGQMAMKHSANHEAIRHFQRGLTLLYRLPDTPVRAQQEFELQAALSSPLLAVKGYGAVETVEAVNRATSLGAQIGDNTRVFPLLYNKMIAQFIWADHREANATAHQFLSLASKQLQTGPRLMGHRIVGLSSLALGELQTSLDHLDQALLLYDPKEHASLALQFGQEPGMATLCIRAWVLWLLGYPDQALASGREALRVARVAGETHYYSLAYGLVWVTTVHQFSRNLPDVQRLAEENCQLCEAHNFQYPLAKAQSHKGWALAESGQLQKGIELMREGLARLESTQGRWEKPYFMGLLAEAHAKAGQPEAGLRVLEEALHLVEETGERFWLAELLRLNGELLRLQGENRAAGLYYQQALAAAQQLQAKSLELRAVMSLCRLWQREGKPEEALRTLSAIMNRFTEGFDSVDCAEGLVYLKDLQQAKHV